MINILNAGGSSDWTRMLKTRESIDAEIGRAFLALIRNHFDPLKDIFYYSNISTCEGQFTCSINITQCIPQDYIPELDHVIQFINDSRKSFIVGEGIVVEIGLIREYIKVSVIADLSQTECDKLILLLKNHFPEVIVDHILTSSMDIAERCKKDIYRKIDDYRRQIARDKKALELLEETLPLYYEMSRAL